MPDHCGSTKVRLQLSLVTGACGDGSAWPTTRVARVKITGDGLAEPRVTVSPLTRLTPPEVPAGTNRVVEIRTFDNDPSAGGQLIAIGTSLPFDVPNTLGEAPLEKTLVLRRVGSWSRPATDASTCQTMTTERAGHTATLLPSGKVLLAGGFTIAPGSPDRVALASTEVFDPASGTTSRTRDLSIQTTSANATFSLAFHTATAIDDRRVLFWGGERYQLVNGVNVALPSAVALVYDTQSDQYGALAQSQPIPRTRHQAVADQNGKVLIVGGLRMNTMDRSLMPVTEVQSFDPTAEASVSVKVGVSLPRVGASAGSLMNGELIAVAGGSDGVRLQDEVVFFRWDTASARFRQAALASPPRLATARRAAAGVVVADGKALLLVGGDGDAVAESPIGTSEVASASTATVEPGPAVAPRADACAVALADRRSALVIGGRVSRAPGSTVSATVELLRANSSGSLSLEPAPSLAVARSFHTCTLLKDGSVLVAGGLSETGTTAAPLVLSDLWIYTPMPSE